MQKKFVSAALSILLVLSLASCGSGKSSGSSDAGAAPESTAPPAGESASAGDGAAAGSEAEASGYTGGTYTFKLAHQLNDAHIGSQLANDFAAETSKLSGGKITIEVYGSSQLGNQAENAEAVRMGTVDFCLNDFPTLATVYPMADIVALPYMFDSYDHVGKFFDSDRCKTMIDDIASTAGIRVIGPSYDAFRAVFSQQKIASTADMKNLRIRVPDIPLYVSTFDALGCSTTIVSFSEIYTALQTGVVSALENSYNTVFTSALFEQTKYIAKTNHIFCDMSIMANEALFQGLDDEAKAVILKAADTAARAHRERVKESDQKYCDMLVEKGMEVNEVNIDEFRAACAGVWKQYTEKVEGGQDLIDYVQGLK